jgi:hypothetical protein
VRSRGCAYTPRMTDTPATQFTRAHSCSALCVWPEPGTHARVRCSTRPRIQPLCHAICAHVCPNVSAYLRLIAHFPSSTDTFLVVKLAALMRAGIHWQVHAHAQTSKHDSQPRALICLHYECTEHTFPRACRAIQHAHTHTHMFATHSIGCVYSS